MKKTIYTILLFFTIAPCLWAQDSIIEKVMAISNAVVEVMAENSSIYQGGSIKTGINPQTGRLVAVRKALQQSYQRSGAGVIIHPDGIIVTNAHTGYQANTIKIALPSGEIFYAQPIRLVNDLDLLLLKINTDQPLTFVEFADSDNITLGQEVITIGNSPFLKNTISGGKIIGIGVNRKLKHTGKQRTDLIQTTVNLYHGDSGGPLFNSNGRLIGLMTADEGATDHSSFAIPSNKIKKFLIEYLNNK